MTTPGEETAPAGRLAPHPTDPASKPSTVQHLSCWSGGGGGKAVGGWFRGKEQLVVEEGRMGVDQVQERAGIGSNLFHCILCSPPGQPYTGMLGFLPAK